MQGEGFGSNRWLGYVMQLLGLGLLVVVMTSSLGRWFPNPEYNWMPQVSRSIVTWTFVLVIAGGAANLIVRSLVTTIVATSATAVGLVVSTAFAFSSQQPAIGPAYPLALFALLAILVGMAIAPLRRPASAENDEVGEMVDGKRHGPWLVYRGSKVVEMRRYDHGELLETRPYGR